jgi:SAM-dependent methyltransferase
MDKELITYYAERATEYEKIYERPERQSDLAAINELLQVMYIGKDVGEIACGTGYWTQRIAKHARAVAASDINPPVLDIAKVKVYEKNNVTFNVADIFNYPLSPHDNLFAGFILSHIKKQELNNFIDTVHKFVKPGGVIIFTDNNYVVDSNRPITHTDEHGNTYQERILENGKKYSILKNFPTEELFFKLLKDKGDGLKYISLKYYWVLCYNRK